MNTIVLELSRLIGVDELVEDAITPCTCDQVSVVQHVFADDEGELLRLFHGIHDDKNICWRNP